jgi:hypothetical protein
VPGGLAAEMDELRASRGSTIRARAELLMPAKGIQILHDPDQRTAVVIQLFETAGDMAAAEGPLDEMDPADTRGRAPPSTAARSRPSWAWGERAPRRGRLDSQLEPSNSLPSSALGPLSTLRGGLAQRPSAPSWRSRLRLSVCTHSSAIRPWSS